MAVPERHTHTTPRPFHPGQDRMQEGLYIAFDAAAHDQTPAEIPMAYQTAATALTALFVLGEMVLFYLVFGAWGLLAIAASTTAYTLIDKRARSWAINRLKNSLDD